MTKQEPDNQSSQHRNKTKPKGHKPELLSLPESVTGTEFINQEEVK